VLPGQELENHVENHVLPKLMHGLEEKLGAAWTRKQRATFLFSLCVLVRLILEGNHVYILMHGSHELPIRKELGCLIYISQLLLYVWKEFVDLMLPLLS
jgi:hypothetical protein